MIYENENNNAELRSGPEYDWKSEKSIMNWLEINWLVLAGVCSLLQNFLCRILDKVSTIVPCGVVILMPTRRTSVWRRRTISMLIIEKKKVQVLLDCSFTNCIVFYFWYVWTLGLGLYIALAFSLLRLGFEVHMKSLYSVVFDNMVQKSAQMHMWL